MDCTSGLLQPLEDVIRKRFILALTGRMEPGDIERQLLALPAKLGGLGLADPQKTASSEFDASRRVTAPLSDLVVAQSMDLNDVCAKVSRLKRAAHSEKAKCLKSSGQAILPLLPAETRRAAQLASEKGASTWLMAIPLDRYGFALHKGAFRDALCLRYNWPPPMLPISCVCGQAFSASHALSCPTGGYPPFATSCAI